MPKRRRAVSALALVLLGAISACSESTLSVGGELALELSGDSVATVTDSLVLFFDVTGQQLLGIVVEYGDAAVDSVAFAGAQTAGGRLAHLYASPGEYVVSAVVEDALAGNISDQLSVRITP